ncbi:Scr1 family TA system antitoxin-like transcriptional regulator [Actinopolyspora xinjiangensis]|uniref:Scr1 family TA system antitoxin-like transcriptional regulator n=1 Tax=Actinopolyspora xinjiangensis TaxID=405564 RepID=UPI0031399EFC
MSGPDCGSEPIRQVDRSFATGQPDTRSEQGLDAVLLAGVARRVLLESGFSGAFLVFHFPKSAPIVHVENFHSTTFLHKSRDVAAYDTAATTLQQLTMTPEDSIELIAKIKDEMERQL